MGKVRFSPYTYARVAVMKSKLLKKHDYHKLQKMGSSEAWRFLQDTKDLKGQAITPIEIEKGLNENLLASLNKLYRISEGGLRELIKIHLLRYELENLKIILRGKFAGVDNAQTKELLYNSFQHFKEEFLNDLQAKEIAEVIGTLPLLKDTNVELMDLENAIDKYYINVLKDFVNDLNSVELRKLIEEELDLINVKTVLALQGSDEITKYLVNPSKIVMELVKLPSNEMAGFLAKEGKVRFADTNLEDLELNLDLALLNKQIKLQRGNMLSANHIIGYLLAKKIEIRNLKVLLKGKLLGLEEEILQRMIVA
jgi:V/A-type H+/Na+-transporting ATPase subunit C